MGPAVIYSSCLEPKPVVCVNQLVVALPLAAIALDDAPDNPFIRRRPRGRVSQVSNVALDGCLAMTPDSLRFSESHCGSPHLSASVVSLLHAMPTPSQVLHAFCDLSDTTKCASGIDWRQPVTWEKMKRVIPTFLPGGPEFFLLSGVGDMIAESWAVVTPPAEETP